MSPRVKEAKKSLVRNIKVDPDSLFEIFYKNRDLLQVGGKKLPSSDPIWKDLAAESGLTPKTLHQYAGKYLLKKPSINRKRVVIDEKANSVFNYFSSSAPTKRVNKKKICDEAKTRVCKVKVEKLNLDVKNLPFLIPKPEPDEPKKYPLRNRKRDEALATKAANRSGENRTPSPTQKRRTSPDARSEDHQVLQNLKTEVTDSQDSTPDNKTTDSGASRCIASIFAAHEKLKRFLGTLVQFTMGLGPETGDQVRHLVLELLSKTLTPEEFHSALQDATNYPLRDFVLPYLKETLPALQRDLNATARAKNQTSAQFLRANETAVLEAVRLAPPTSGSGGESVEPFAEPSVVAPHSTGTSSTGHHYPPPTRPPPPPHAPHLAYSSPSHAAKRRASDVFHYENGTAFDDGSPYAKRWSHYQPSVGPHHQSHQGHSSQHQASDLAYCWYNHPLGQGQGVPSLVQFPGGVQQPGLCGYGPPPLPVSHTPLQHANISHSGSGTSGSMAMQNGSASSLDDEWKNIFVMMNCVLGMMNKLIRAVAIVQKRGSTSPAATTAPTSSSADGSNLSANGGPPSSNGIETNGDRDGTFKRLSAEIIRANEDRIAEVKRKAEEAVQEVKRAAMVEVQRAVAVAMAESRGNERLRNHRYLDNLPVNRSLQRNYHPHARPSPFLRISEGRTIATTTTTSVVGSSTSSTTNNVDDLDKDSTHLQSGLTTSCWNCGRPAMESCGGCGIARYCGAFCQHRDWEAGGHHATCSNTQNSQERARSATPSPPMRPAAAEPKSSSTISLSGSISRNAK